MDALKMKDSYTIDYIYNLPEEGERAELIDGQIYYMAPPSRKHQEIAGALYRKISDYIDSKSGGCIEIASPGNRKMDYFIKLFKYRSPGVKEYWIVDIVEKSITVYDF